MYEASGMSPSQAHMRVNHGTTCGAFPVQVHKVVSALSEAAVDERVKGLIAYVGTSAAGAGLAVTQELRAAVQKFRHGRENAHTLLGISRDLFCFCINSMPHRPKYKRPTTFVKSPIAYAGKCLQAGQHALHIQIRLAKQAAWGQLATT
jgi:hypothetical protein